MNSKLLLLVFGLVALSCIIEAKHVKKSISKKKLTYGSTTADKALGHIRSKRDTEEKKDSSSEELTDEQAASLTKFFVAVGWEENKLDMLGDFLEEMADDETNITVIGWQKIYDEQGEVQEVNTIELVIPPKPEDNDKDETDLSLDEDDEDEDSLIPHNQIEELRDLIAPLYELGIPVSITMEEYDRHGEDETQIFLDLDELYVSSEGFAIYNKTSTALIEEVEAFYKKLPKNIFGDAAVLRYDVDGILEAEKSHINPVYLGGVESYYEAPDEILLESPTIIAHVAYRYPRKEIPKQLVQAYDKEFPEYTWRVLVDPEHYYITRDVSIRLSYDNLDFHESSQTTYLVYGTKKVQTE